MCYAGIIGKNHTLSRYELSSAWSKITHQLGLITFFANDKPDIHRAGLTKWGKVVSSRELHETLKTKQPSLLGCDNKTQAMAWKKQYDFIKRIKVIEPIKTDYDIKTKGLEVICLPQEQYLIIDHYQNIPLYEAIDVEKPVSGMTIGMMPAKLTHLLLNIAINTYTYLPTRKAKKQRPTIRDPFTGFGTTNMTANAIDYNTIGSDINITQAKRNIEWRTLQSFATDQKITLRKHDVTQPFGPVFSHADIIVSEWRLWPIVTSRTQDDALARNVDEIADLYSIFFKNIAIMGNQAPSVIVMTIPEYDRYDGSQPRDVLQSSSPFAPFASSTTSPDEVYRRKGQRVGRRVIIWNNLLTS